MLLELEVSKIEMALETELNKRARVLARVGGKTVTAEVQGKVLSKKARGLAVNMTGLVLEQNRKATELAKGLSKKAKERVASKTERALVRELSRKVMELEQAVSKMVREPVVSRTVLVQELVLGSSEMERLLERHKSQGRNQSQKS